MMYCKPVSYTWRGGLISGFYSWLGGGDPFLKPRLKLRGPVILLSAGATLAPAAVCAQQVSISSMVHRQHQGPLNITGRNFVYDYKTNTFVVTGDAVVTQQATILTADEIDLARGKRELHAKGRVHLVDPLSEIRAREGRLNLPDETGVLTDATISNYNKTFRLEGARVQKFPVSTTRYWTACTRLVAPSPANRTGASRPIKWMFRWATPPPRTVRTSTFSATRCCTRRTRFFRPIPAAIRGF